MTLQKLYVDEVLKPAERGIAVCPRGYKEDRSLIPKVWEYLHTSKLCPCKRYGLFPT